MGARWARSRCSRSRRNALAPSTPSSASQPPASLWASAVLARCRPLALCLALAIAPALALAFAPTLYTLFFTLTQVRRSRSVARPYSTARGSSRTC